MLTSLMWCRRTCTTSRLGDIKRRRNGQAQSYLWSGDGREPTKQLARVRLLQCRCAAVQSKNRVVRLQIQIKSAGLMQIWICKTQRDSLWSAHNLPSCCCNCLRNIAINHRVYALLSAAVVATTQSPDHTLRPFCVHVENVVSRIHN